MFTITRQPVNKKSGLTVVELLLTLAILVLVLGAGYLLYFFALKSYTAGEMQSNVQSNIQLAAQIITTELRNATKISGNVNEFNGMVFYCLRINSRKQLVIDTYDAGGNVASTSIKTEGIIDDIDFSLESLNNRLVLNFAISGGNRETNRTYGIRSNILLNNINFGTVAGDKIYYTKP